MSDPQPRTGFLARFRRQNRAPIATPAQNERAAEQASSLADLARSDVDLGRNAAERIRDDLAAGRTSRDQVTAAAAERAAALDDAMHNLTVKTSSPTTTVRIAAEAYGEWQHTSPAVAQRAVNLFTAAHEDAGVAAAAPSGRSPQQPTVTGSTTVPSAASSSGCGAQQPHKTTSHPESSRRQTSTGMPMACGTTSTPLSTVSNTTPAAPQAPSSSQRTRTPSSVPPPTPKPSTRPHTKPPAPPPPRHSATSSPESSTAGPPLTKRPPPNTGSSGANRQPPLRTSTTRAPAPVS